MDEKEKQRIIDRYNQRLDQHGVSINALASGSEDRRKIRFDVLTEIGVAPGDSVLDLGCGFGDYWNYLRSRDIVVDYLGVDINARLVDEARKRNPQVKFAVADIQKDDIGEFDWIVSTSCFNLRISNPDNYTFVADLFSSCYRKARKGVAVDFLTSYVDFQGNPTEAFYYEPERVFSIAKKITKRVTLRHDYPLFEFCIYLLPDFSGWQKNQSKSV